MLFVFSEYLLFANPQGITGFFVVSLFNFQGSALNFVQLRWQAPRLRAFLFYHICFALSSTFLKILKNFFKFSTAPRLRQPVYFITSSSLCQAFFRFFQNFFLPASAPVVLPSPALFPLSGGFLRLSGPVSLRQCWYSNTAELICQAENTLFFAEFSRLTLCTYYFVNQCLKSRTYLTPFHIYQPFSTWFCTIEPLFYSFTSFSIIYLYSITYIYYCIRTYLVFWFFGFFLVILLTIPYYNDRIVM